MMYSFYSGKQGRTYNIVERFDYVWVQANKTLKKAAENQTVTLVVYFGDIVFNEENRKYYQIQYKTTEQGISIDKEKILKEEYAFEVKGMVNEFAKGGAYTDVNYGEYVIIDTILTRDHRSDDKNGLLYRRGFDYNQTILTDVPERQQKDEQGNYIYYNDDMSFNNDKWTIAWKNYVLNPGAGAIYVGQIVGPKGDAPELRGKTWEEFLEVRNVHKKEILDASYSQGVKKNGENWDYQDTYRFGYATIKDPDGDIIGAYISFDFTKTVLKVSAQSISPYGDTLNFKDDPSNETDTYNVTGTYNSETKQWKYDNLIHQHSYTGIDGENEQHPFYYNYNIAIPKGIHGQDIEKIKVEKAENFDEGTTVYSRTGEEKQEYNKNDLYFTYSLRNYNETENGELTEHQGRWPYRVINNITGIKGDRKSSSIWNNINEIVQIGQLFEVNAENNYYAICIKEGYKGDNPPYWNANDALPNVEDHSNFQFGYETFVPNSENRTGAIWRNIYLNSAIPIQGFDIDYTAEENNRLEGNLFKFLDYIVIDHEGKMHAFYSNGTSQYLTTLHDIDEIYYNNEDNIEDEQRIQVKYKDGQIQNVSKPINRILAMQRVGDTVAVLYSDPAYRDKITEGKTEGVDYYKLPYTDSSKEYENLVWQNWGSIGGNFHIHQRFSSKDDFEDAIGSGGSLENGIPLREWSSHAGWVVAVDYDQTSTGGGKGTALFAYDYIKKEWFKVHDFGDSLVISERNVRLSSENGVDTDPLKDYYKQDKLVTDGLWFVISGGKDKVGS